MFDQCFRQRGGTIQEAVIAIAIAVSVLVGVVQHLALVSQQRRATEQRSVAMQEASNVMETLMVCEWDALDQGQTPGWEFSRYCRELLPNCQLHTEVIDVEDSHNTREIRLHIDWENRAGGRTAPVWLSAWRIREESDS